MLLHIDNSYSRITGLHLKDYVKLREALSYTVGGKSAFFSKYGPRKKCLLSKKGEFPTGLLSRVLAIIDPEYNADLTRVDNRIIPRIKSPIKGSWKNIVPYEAQLLAVSAAILNGSGTISMPTGTGKSLIIALIINELKLKTLVIVPSLEIKKQLTNSLNSIFNDMTYITVENIDSKVLTRSTDYDCLIIDEAHHAAAATYQKLNKMAWTKINQRFFLTATPFRNDTEETLLYESIAGRVIYKLDYHDAVSKGYIVPVAPLYLEVPKRDTDAYTYAQVYSELVVHNTTRNLMIATLAARLVISGKSTLVLVREVAHGKILADLAGLPFVSGEDAESRDYIRQFNFGEIKGLIGTTGVIGEGIDTKPCEYVVIAGLGKAKSQLMQQVGRCVRRYPGKEYGKVILIKDRSHKFTTRHFNAQAAILTEEYGAKPLKLELE